MNTLEIKKELNRLEAYIQKMETVPPCSGQRICMTKIAERWHMRLLNEQVKLMHH